MIAEVEFAPGKKGYLARPAGDGRWPAVIQLHERYGVVQHTTDIAERLAENGYVALAPDMFSRFTGDREALARGDVGVGIRDDQALTDLDECMAYLRGQDFVDGGRIAVMGVCQTGRQPLLAAAYRDDLRCAVVFYGGIYQRDWEPHEERPTPVGEFIKRLSCPVLGVFGDSDHIISVDDVLRFRRALEDSWKSYSIRIFPDAPHGWLNDTMPGRYRLESAEAAWELLFRFLAQHLAADPGPSRVEWEFEGDIPLDYDFSKTVRLA
ncbi:MAG: dienelactone hydrolase family protein [Deltaproteobacteria bacterium]|nr:dienelactone hydrolase family protein [Deltaproteobacteria bacterium]